MEKYVEITTEFGVTALLASAVLTLKDETRSITAAELAVGDQFMISRNGAIVTETVEAVGEATMAIIQFTTSHDGKLDEITVPHVTCVNVNDEPIAVADLKVDDRFSAIVNGDFHSGTVVAVVVMGQPSETKPEDQEAAQERRIAELESKVATLMETLEVTNEIVLGLQRSIVEMTAAHMDRLFSDPVMVDTLAQRFLIAGANAIAHKAKTSRQRAPQLVVIEGQIPGCVLRARLLEDGSVEIEQQDKEGVWVGGAGLPEELQKQEIINTFGGLLLSYGAEVGRLYYITDDISRDEFREQASKKAQEHLAGVEQASATTH